MGKRASKFVILFLFFVFVFYAGNALTIATDKEEYIKGEEIHASGNCDSDKVKISLQNSERKVFEKEVNCLDSSFELNYLITFLDPGGIWLLKAYSLGEEKTTRVRVKPSRESQFYLITFLSPSKESYLRTEDLNVRVRITDAGENLEGAAVFTWDVFGEKKQLIPMGKGLYSLPYQVPVDASIGNWKIVVTAEKIVEGERFGGEKSRFIAIENGWIKIELVKPKVKNFAVGSAAVIELKASYLNGKRPLNPIASLSFDGKTIEMAHAGDGIFIHSLALGKNDVGTKKINLLVKDEFGNSGESQIEIVVSEGPLFWIIEVGPYTIILFGIIVAILFFALSRVKKKKAKKRLEKQRQAVEEKIKKVQQDYFENGKISKRKYKQKIAELEATLSEIRQRLKIR